MQPTIKSPKSAFTLVELSVVLVIIGLLAGGILMGQSMIRNAQVQSVLADAQNYAAAIRGFKDKYEYLPGDFPMATHVWGSSAAYCTSSLDAANGTCNGNGDGLITTATGSGATGEAYQLWRQLALAGMIKGNFTGIAGTTGNNPLNDAKPGINIPMGAIANTGYWHVNWGYQSASTTWYEGDYTNAMVFGGSMTGASNGPWPHGSVLTGAEAYAIDKKVDDGVPAFGTIRTMAYTWITSNNGVICSSSDTASSAIYVLNNSSPTCFLLFLNTFGAPLSSQ